MVVGSREGGAKPVEGSHGVDWNRGYYRTVHHLTRGQRRGFDWAMSDECCARGDGDSANKREREGRVVMQFLNIYCHQVNRYKHYLDTASGALLFSLDFFIVLHPTTPSCRRMTSWKRSATRFGIRWSCGVFARWQTLEGNRNQTPGRRFHRMSREGQV